MKRHLAKIKNKYNKYIIGAAYEIKPLWYLGLLVNLLIHTFIITALIFDVLEPFSIKSPTGITYVFNPNTMSAIDLIKYVITELKTSTVFNLWVISAVTSIFTILKISKIRRNTSKNILKYINIDLIDDIEWKNIVNALIKGSIITEEHQGDEGNVYFCILHKLFDATADNVYYNTFVFYNNSSYEDFEYQRLIDIENAVLWKKYLNDSPLLERISLLKHINTDDEIRAFLNRSEVELEQFKKPFYEFYKFVDKVKSDKEFRIEQLRKEGITSYDEILNQKEDLVQKEIDELMKFSMKELYKRPTMN